MYAVSRFANIDVFVDLSGDMKSPEICRRGPRLIRGPLALWEKAQSPLMTQSPARLSELWLKRGSLSEAELVELCQRVADLLQPVVRRVCANLPDTPEEYVAQFSMEKVIALLPGHKSNFQIQGDNETKAYIRYAFERFVSDIRRSNARADLRLDYVDAEYLEGHAAPDAEDGGSPIEILAAAGISFDAAVEYANDFVGDLSRAEMLFLYYHTCMDYDDKHAEREHGKGSVPLSKLARQFEIKNYYRIATELGITGMRAGYVADFTHSKLGRWMKRCGLRIDADHWDEMKAMLKILCGVVFDSDFDRVST